MTDDRERLEQYLEWRRTADRERAARRRRWLGSTAVVVAIGAVAGGLIAWLADGARDAPARVTTVRPLERRSPVAAAPDVEPPGVAAPVPPREEPAAPPRATPAPGRRPANSTRPRATAAPPPTRPSMAPVPPDESADVAAAVAPPMPAPVTHPTTPVDATPETPAPVPAPRDDVVAQPAAPEPDAAPPAREPKVSDRVAGWLKGEVQEFRDGVKREIGEFRSGYDKVRGAVLKLRGTRAPER